jgi:hypothetical protein
MELTHLINEYRTFSGKLPGTAEQQIAGEHWCQGFGSERDYVLVYQEVPILQQRQNKV